MLGGGELGRQPAGDTVILRLLCQDVLVHVQVCVDPLLLQPSHDGGQYVDVGLVNLERSNNQYRARTEDRRSLTSPSIGSTPDHMEPSLTAVKPQSPSCCCLSASTILGSYLRRVLGQCIKCEDRGLPGVMLDDGVDPSEHPHPTISVYKVPVVDTDRREVTHDSQHQTGQHHQSHCLSPTGSLLATVYV